MAGTGSFISVPILDYINKAWTPSSGTLHYALIDEGLVTPNDTDYLSASVVNRNDRWNMTDNLPAVAKFITKIIYGVRCTGRDTSVDISLTKYQSGGATLPGFFQKCDVRTQTDGNDDWQTRYFTKTSGVGPVPRASFEGGHKTLMKSITGGTGFQED